jgi:hypothetical protein
VPDLRSSRPARRLTEAAAGDVGAPAGWRDLPPVPARVVFASDKPADQEIVLSVARAAVRQDNSGRTVSTNLAAAMARSAVQSLSGAHGPHGPAMARWCDLAAGTLHRLADGADPDGLTALAGLLSVSGAGDYTPAHDRLAQAAADGCWPHGLAPDEGATALPLLCAAAAALHHGDNDQALAAARATVVAGVRELDAGVPSERHHHPETTNA